MTLKKLHSQCCWCNRKATMNLHSYYNKACYRHYRMHFVDGSKERIAFYADTYREGMQVYNR